MRKSRWAALGLCWASCCFAQGTEIDAGARRDIDRGNQAWIEGMKRGEAKRIAETYAEDAVDCSGTGECIQGRAAVERLMRDRIAQVGRATSAKVTSKGSAQQGDFVYEWGEAEASFANGNRIGGRYLTVWRKAPDGRWEIFRNMRIPADR